MGLRSRTLAFRTAAILLFAALAVALLAACEGEPASPNDEGTPAAGTSPPPAEPADETTPTPAPDPTPYVPGSHVQAVVSAHEIATEAGVEILRQGGSAADAAVAVAAALTVVEPWFSSALGGGTWALYYDAANDEVTSLEGVGPTGSLATVADFRQRAGQPGMHQANVPGAWDGWMLWLDRHGRLDLGDVLAPAITAAREGYTVGPQMSAWLNSQASQIVERPSTARIYAPNGSVLPQGATVQLPDLADTFEALAAAYDERLDDGRSAAIQAARDYFYRGPLAEAIVDYSDRFGGYLTLDDFHSFEARIVAPISAEYQHGITVYQNPPNSQGITMLIALNILRGFDLSTLDAHSTDAVHLQVEALKLAFSDRYYHVGDPDRIEVPVDELLSRQHAADQRGRIDMDSALSWPIPDGLDIPAVTSPGAANTTTFHVVDRDGNAAAVTTSLGAQFYVIGDTGIHINNRMRFLALDDGNPNQLAPGYKVRHTSNPYMAFRDGRPYILGGNTGADVQSQGQVQQFVNIVEFGFSAQDAVSRPRFVITSFPGTIYPYTAANTLRLESGFPGSLVEQLRARGHSVEANSGASFGNAGAIVINEEGSDAEVGADPRNGTSSGTVFQPEP